MVSSSSGSWCCQLVQNVTEQSLREISGRTKASSAPSRPGRDGRTARRHRPSRLAQGFERLAVAQLDPLWRRECDHAVAQRG